jgi:DNA end-binding protein Ku
MAALRASVEAARKRGSRVVADADDGGGADGGLDALSKEELYERAKAADIPGRSDMSKQELIKALRAA